ncbi:MAG: peptide chain release factor 1 [Candidatus Dasytiphilus stammeri]
MKSSIIAQIELLKKRYKEVDNLLQTSEIISNHKLFRVLAKEYAHLSEIMKYFCQWQTIQENINTTSLLLQDPEIRDLAEDELFKIRQHNKLIEHKLKLLLIPQDPDDDRNCYIEIRAGTGGDEAAIFAGDLFRMYYRYAEARYWKMEIISASEGEHGGYKTIIVKVTGNSTYGSLKFESGGHRVQRVPETESQGRIHTSACTVAVMPEMPENKIMTIQTTDLKIDTFRSSGAGGQHVNTTDSAIRITHLPTGIVVECQDERSQHKNKTKALSVLSARLNAAEIAKRHQEETSTRRNLLASGERSDRTRTYNFPQGRVTDHRINLTLYCLEKIMNGNLDILIDQLRQEYQNQQLANL